METFFMKFKTDLYRLHQAFHDGVRKDLTLL
jgi:hypothetical protein